MNQEIQRGEENIFIPDSLLLWVQQDKETEINFFNGDLFCRDTLWSPPVLMLQF